MGEPGERHVNLAIPGRCAGSPAPPGPSSPSRPQAAGARRRSALGGSEDRRPPEPFAAAFERARALGLHTTAHAGEADGPASIWGALRALRVERIGHGVRAREDPALVEHLRRTQVPLEMCPVSNLRTGAVARLDDHPVRAYFDAGLLVTVSTDDPAMFDTTLTGEYALLESALGFRRDELRRVAGNAARASWLPAGEKAALLARIDAHPAWRAAG